VVRLLPGGGLPAPGAARPGGVYERGLEGWPGRHGLQPSRGRYSLPASRSDWARPNLLAGASASLRPRRICTPCSIS